MLHGILVLALLFLVGCGGASGTLQMSMPTPPVEPKPPEFTPPRQSSQWQDNPNAEDPQDHWNHPQLLSLTPVDPADAATRRGVIADLLTSAEPASMSSATRFRNVRADDIEIIGERDGITYGQWKGGPAGTLNIEFDWRFAEEFPPRTRARMDRSGKFWSRRLLDDFGTHVVKKGTNISSRRSVAFEEDVSTDGILIAVLQVSSDSLSTGRPVAADITEDDYEPWLGVIRLTPQVSTSTMVHEIGHALGMVGNTGNRYVPTWERYVNREDHTFEGPQSKIANGGNAVPFQWLNEDRDPVPPNTPGATVDYHHLGVCTSIMAYCRDNSVVYGPSELDFAFLADVGYEILDAETASEPEVYGYGAWGRYSAWGAGVERTLPAVLRARASEDDKLRAGADAFGISPAREPRRSSHTHARNYHLDGLPDRG